MTRAQAAQWSQEGLAVRVEPDGSRLYATEDHRGVRIDGEGKMTVTEVYDSRHWRPFLKITRRDADHLTLLQENVHET